MTNDKRLFTVNGKPFFPVGRHRIYMGGYSVRDEAEIEANFKASKLSNANTVCLAIFWDQLEPEEGKFDFSSIDSLITIARRYELKLIFLWFATSKNGVMDYAPQWMKSNPQRYKRVTASNGTKLWVLSTHCQANLDADKKAFTAEPGCLNHIAAGYDSANHSQGNIITGMRVGSAANNGQNLIARTDVA